MSTCFTLVVLPEGPPLHPIFVAMSFFSIYVSAPAFSESLSDAFAEGASWMMHHPFLSIHSTSLKFLFVYIGTHEVYALCYSQMRKSIPRRQGLYLFCSPLHSKRLEHTGTQSLLNASSNWTLCRYR